MKTQFPDGKHILYKTSNYLSKGMKAHFSSQRQHGAGGLTRRRVRRL
jgi:hypothetical protein